MDDYPHKELTRAIIGAAMDVHSALGPGLLESAYEICLADELRDRGIQHERQCDVPIEYKGRLLNCGYRLDFLVEQQVVVELKSIESVQPVHKAQLLTYLKLTGKPVGLLINFNVSRLRDGVTRQVLSETPTASSASSAALRSISQQEFE